MAQKRTVKPAENRASAGNGATPPSRVRCPLGNLDNLKAELARVYRQAKGGSIRVEDASKLANILAILGRLMEGAELEARIAELERARSNDE